MTLTTTLSGTICHCRLEYVTVNLPTEFEVSTFSSYGDMKCVKNPQNWGGLGWLGVTQGHHATSILCSRFLLL